MWTKTNRCLIRMKDPYLIDASSPSTYTSTYMKEIKQRTQQFIQLNIGAKKTQLNPDGPDQRNMTSGSNSPIYTLSPNRDKSLRSDPSACN